MRFKYLELRSTIKKQAETIANLKSDLSRAYSDLSRREGEIRSLRIRLAEALKDGDEDSDRRCLIPIPTMVGW